MSGSPSTLITTELNNFVSQEWTESLNKPKQPEVQEKSLESFGLCWWKKPGLRSVVVMKPQNKEHQLRPCQILTVFLAKLSITTNLKKVKVIQCFGISLKRLMTKSTLLLPLLIPMSEIIQKLLSCSDWRIIMITPSLMSYHAKWNRIATCIGISLDSEILWARLSGRGLGMINLKPGKSTPTSRLNWIRYQCQMIRKSIIQMLKRTLTMEVSGCSSRTLCNSLLTPQCVILVKSCTMSKSLNNHMMMIGMYLKLYFLKILVLTLLSLVFINTIKNSRIHSTIFKSLTRSSKEISITMLYRNRLERLSKKMLRVAWSLLMVRKKVLRLSNHRLLHQQWLRRLSISLPKKRMSSRIPRMLTKILEEGQF